MRKLNEKQKLFCKEYIIDLNAYQAAIRAGYAEKTAKTKAHKWLEKASFRAYLTELMADREKRTMITQDMVVSEIAKLAFANATTYASVEKVKLFDINRDDDVEEDDFDDVAPETVEIDGVKIKRTAQLSDEQKAAIVGIKQGKFGIEIKLADKVKALELLGRHLGMFNDKLDLNVPVNITVNRDYGD